MDGGHARAALLSADVATQAADHAARQVTAPRTPTSGLRILLAERRATAQSELSRRLDDLGHEVLARVTSVRGALDYAELLRPDAVLVAPVLEDGPGVMAALTLTRELPGVAAVLLASHPAAADPAARPNWGAITLVPVSADATDLNAELWRAVAAAREALRTSDSQDAFGESSDMASADLPSPLDAIPCELTPAGELRIASAPVPAAMPAPAVQRQPSDKRVPVSIETRAVAEAMVTKTASAPMPDVSVTAQSAPTPESAPDAARPQRPAPVAQAGREALPQRSPLSFTDEDLFAIGPFVDSPETTLPTPMRPAAAPTPAPAPAPSPVYGTELEIIAQAAETLLDRTGLSRSDAMRLMEQEAADTGRSLVDVARTVMGDGTAATEVALSA